MFSAEVVGRIEPWARKYSHRPAGARVWLLKAVIRGPMGGAGAGPISRSIWLQMRQAFTDTISQSIGGTGVSPVQAQARACGYHKMLFDCNSVWDAIPRW